MPIYIHQNPTNPSNSSPNFPTSISGHNIPLESSSSSGLLARTVAGPPSSSRVGVCDQSETMAHLLTCCSFSFHNVGGLVHLGASQRNHLRRRSTQLSSSIWHDQDGSQQWVAAGARGLAALLPARAVYSDYRCHVVIHPVLPFLVLAQTLLSINASRCKAFAFSQKITK